MSNIYAERLDNLREVMRREGVDAIIIPTADYHGSEYVAPCFRLRAHYSGFTGSAGTLLVTAGRHNNGVPVSSAGLSSGGAAEDGAFLWTDGRYFIQAERELEGTGVTLMRMGEPGVPTLNDFLAAALPAGGTLAFDGRCMTAAEGLQLKKALRVKNITIRSDADLAGDLWADRPALPSHPVWILEEKYAGESASSKLARLRGKMARKGVTAFVSGKLDEIMWLYNLRGGDVTCNPVALSYTVVTERAALLYLQESELTKEVRAYLKETGVEWHPYEDFIEDLADMRLGRQECPACGEGDGEIGVWIDADAASYAVRQTICGNIAKAIGLPEDLPERYAEADLAEHLVETLSPVTSMKAIRNETEIRNFKSCYIEDSAVLTKYIYWLKKQVEAGVQLSEGQAAAKLDGMRAEISDFVELSFGTISAYGSNAAMMHYDYGMSGGGALLRAEGMYLVDSGGHYLRGTTDVTRTIALGPVTEEMRRDYTLTAVSQLQMMDTVFMKGCNGMSLDIMAREPMWSRGMDYKCGTGHGIGYLLNVHEGPNNLRWRARGASDAAPFEPGMVISDEPGVYKSGRSWNAGASCGAGTADASSSAGTADAAAAARSALDVDFSDTQGSTVSAAGKDVLSIQESAAPQKVSEGCYGIRIETILITKEWGTTPDGEFLCFEPLTFVPLDPELIDPSYLTPETKASLNRYHAQVLEKLTPFMNEEELAWLRAQCAAIPM